MSPNHKLIFALCLMGSILNTPTVNAADDFVDLERSLMNCNYTKHFQRPHLLEKGFQIPSRDICEQVQARAEEKVSQLHSQEPSFPSYETILRKRGFSQKYLLSKKGLLGPVHQAQPENPFKGHSVDPSILEKDLRSTLTPLDKLELCEEVQQLVQNMKPIRFDQAGWKNLLFKKGYSCTIKTFKSLQNELDQMRGTDRFQTHFDARVAAKTQQNLNGTHIIYFPNLGYDLPSMPWQSERERLSPKELKTGLIAAGATIQIIERVTLEPLEQQILMSERQVFKILSQNPTTKFIFYGRSMGGLIAREILKRNPQIHGQVQGLLLGGATPYGSVIADYKSRADVFHDVYKQSQSLISNLIAKAVAVNNPHLLKVLRASSRRLNLEKMSHKNFTPSVENFSFPVVNLVFLPDSLESFFQHSPRSQNVDYVLLHMSMYGPTEGSAPLAHAIVESPKSGTVFISKYNHLAFWEMTESDAIKLTGAALSLLK